MQCETCSKELLQSDKLYVLWKWPEIHKATRFCKSCGELAYNKFLDNLEELKK